MAFHLMRPSGPADVPTAVPAILLEPRQLHILLDFGDRLSLVQDLDESLEGLGLFGSRFGDGSMGRGGERGRGRVVDA
jgi:hypothetical protein